ncbi:MAG: AcrB/AcrD/AcrF family protein, partial [Gammaproteobacteria bacterium]
MMERMLRQPHAILAITLVGIISGLLAYINMPMNLFPDTNRPVISVVTQWPGAAADDVATEVTHLIEVRLSAIDGVRRVTSTSRDQVSAVQVEFEYSIPIETAATAVNTELPRVRSLLPAGIREPLIFKITDAANPAMVLAITSAPASHLSLGQLRQIAENSLRDRLLNIPGVAEAEVFGGDHRQVSIDVDRDALQAIGLTIGVVAAILQRSNISIPSGEMHTADNRYLLTTQTLAETPEELAATLIPVKNGDFVRLGDIAAVHWGAADATSLYRGNGQAAVAVSLLRGERGHTREVLNQIQAQLPEIKAAFPSLNIQVADTQGRLIDLTVDNMLSALRDAVIMTLLVILLFLGNSRAALITALSLPFTYILTFAAMQAMGYEFNMVTLTAIIIAVGLLADDAIVVIENIERRMRGSGRIDIKEAAAGTS